MLQPLENGDVIVGEVKCYDVPMLRVQKFCVFWRNEKASNKKILNN